MPKIHVNKSILINAPVDQVYNILNNFNHWQSWSPWLIMDPSAKVEVAEDNKYYSWEGKTVGSGNMKITAEKQHESIDYDLTFLTPWKSEAKVAFELKTESNGTHVSWSMDSSLPFFMFWMKKMMIAFIGMDYQRGLAMLKEHIEEGKVNSKLDFKGTSTYDGCQYIGIKTACKMDALSNQMKDDFAKIHALLEQHPDLAANPPFSIYHKWDMVNGQVVYTSGVPVKNIPTDLPGDFLTGEIPKTQIHTIRHTGPYAHLGNAWSTLYSLQRAKAFKMNKKVDPFEIYLNNPMEVNENELITEVHFAVK